MKHRLKMIWQILRDKQVVVITEDHGKMYYSWNTRSLEDTYQMCAKTANKIKESLDRISYEEIRSFKDDVKQAINEFLNVLWHPVSEKPKKGRMFLYKTIFKGYGVNRIIDGNEWKYIIKYQKATQWLYIDDLFPKEGGNHD